MPRYITCVSGVYVGTISQDAKLKNNAAQPEATLDMLKPCPESAGFFWGCVVTGIQRL